MKWMASRNMVSKLMLLLQSCWLLTLRLIPFPHPPHPQTPIPALQSPCRLCASAHHHPRQL
jgi:hypothetical protein